MAKFRGASTSGCGAVARTPVLMELCQFSLKTFRLLFPSSFLLFFLGSRQLFVHFQTFLGSFLENSVVDRNDLINP